MAFIDTKQAINEYVQGKKWYWYTPLLAGGIYAFVAIARFSDDRAQPLFIAIPQSFDFFLHEMAHIVTAFLPPVLTAAAGSASELLLGLVLIIVAFKTKGYFASLFCALWFMLACQSVGIYMADARAQKLVLFSLGAALSGSDEATHDWHFVFGKLHLLKLDTFIGNSVRGIGDIVGVLALCFAAWLLYQMAANNDSTP